MKLTCEVIGIKSSGTLLSVRLQGSRPDSADWREMGVHEIQIDDTPRNCRAFHLGRRVSVTIEPR
jgi:hypothetical protein